MIKKISAAIFLAALVATPAMAAGTLKAPTRGTTVGGFAANPAGTQQITQHCSGVTACNVLIATCAGNGGTWSETAHDGQGRPTKGACVS